MEYSLRHSMPGRVRLNVPALGRNRGLAEKLLIWLRRQSGVRSARVNYDCASLVLEYDPAHEPMLLALLKRFRGLSLSEVKAFCAQAMQDASPAKPPEAPKNSPLALPTVSLLMAFSANPLVT